ncbi:hypothetical protein B0181_00590 [Moraxella caviae]|uniref:HTH tetR-type domain-containing protein n=1 Tax=Moraxella caviae TaxID=34060 RepID=A0A1T0AC60_9GAMM|nr:hypothetical protein B0181_00590 [Moraxella caviae]
MDDLRAKRTQKAIQDALIELLYQKPYEKITAQDIVQTAMINRSTFYRYYFSKDDLLGKMIEEVRQTYRSALKNRFNAEQDRIVGSTADLTHQERRLLLALFKVRTPKHDFYQEMHTLTKSHFLAYASQKSPHQNWDYHADSYATLFLHGAMYFLQKNQDISESELVQSWEQIVDLLKAE